MSMSDIDEPETLTFKEKQSSIKLCHDLYLSHFVNFTQIDSPSLLNVDTIEKPVDALPTTFLIPRFNSKYFFKEGLLFETLSTRLLLRRNHHKTWLSKHFYSLPRSMLALDASQPWLIFWIVHSFILLGSDNLEDAVDEEFKRFQAKIPQFLKTMLCGLGGFSGGAGQLPHLATTYACLASLVDSRNFDMLLSLNKQTFTCWLKSLRDPVTGGFFVHEGGELDIRGTYCAIAIATILDLDKEALFEDIEFYIKSLQSYDGGIAGFFEEESHAGYTYCGLAALALLQKAHYLDLNALLFWVVQRQSSETGGFQGRCNKLHDSCYSFWCTATIQILSQLKMEIPSLYQPCIFNTKSLQMYILGCCQEGFKENMLIYKGGLKDKPQATPDLYHTCYALSGLSILQFRHIGNESRRFI
ncbi:uncharacterized protein LOC128883474 isoform X2 [Hylaeus volcanicus]|uniref:uncharacterized protein LOC128883474 isoform X2 n=1 Tax=Hylaeus volcanicus TaxID=313075 RepID=UPI0023B85E3C|nr:uncharacterized protein LOC128883474 isoform X2 [Hylaeus volcanicus]